jgi:predicted DNA-binding transcriptional regulator YafY
MLYERSMHIENRLGSVLELIRHGEYSTPRIAEMLGVSVPTVSRDVTALRERGHDIRSLRTVTGWRFVLNAKKPPVAVIGDNPGFKAARG